MWSTAAERHFSIDDFCIGCPVPTVQPWAGAYTRNPKYVRTDSAGSMCMYICATKITKEEIVNSGKMGSQKGLRKGGAEVT